jgi:ABC-type multidrug transport system fused ATPase/permease subunit
MVMAMRIYARRVRPAMGRVRRALGDLGSRLQGTLAGVLVVKIFGREPFEERRFDRASKKTLAAAMDTVRIQSLWMPFVNVLMGVGVGLVLWFGGLSVIRGAVTLGTLVAFTTYINMLLRPVRQTGMMMNVIMRSIAAAERIFEVLDTRPDIRDAPDAYRIPPIEGRVELQGVSFSYDGRNRVLLDVSLSAEPGQMVAVVGPSGAGKTTLVHLIPRFYDVQDGSITLDGHDIRAVTVESLRRQIGIALQSVYLFDTSVRENIAYGSPAASDADIRRVAREVRIHDFVSSLPMGYGTPVGERGVRLSGGQKQRIALARVLLTDPRILILDEPTSSVDAETERRMQEAFERVRAGRTTFVIAHRLWTVRSADQILVLQDGRVVERAATRGRVSAHQSLVDDGGLYSRLYALQFRGESGA